VPLVTTCWRTNLMLRLVPSFGICRSEAKCVIDTSASAWRFSPASGFRGDTVLIVDGTLVPMRDHAVAEQPKSHRYSAHH
jgi:hypothetical protein